MKNSLLFLFIILTTNAIACSCVEQNFSTKFQSSDFIARAIITKNYNNEDSQRFYNAEIKIIELFKGNELKSIIVEGRTDGQSTSSCGIFIPENSELIIYASKNKDGIYTINMCSGLAYFNGLRLKRSLRELDELKVLKKNSISFNSSTLYVPYPEIQRDIKKYNGIELTKSFASYLITFNSDVSVKYVQPLSEFESKIDAEIIKIIEKTRWSRLKNRVSIEMPNSDQLIFNIYYYKAKNGHPSIFSIY